MNDNLYDQFTDRVNNPKFLQSTGNVTKKTTSSTGITSKTVFNFDFKAPKLQFYLNNSNSAQVTFPIKYSLFIKGEWVTVDSSN